MIIVEPAWPTCGCRHCAGNRATVTDADLLADLRERHQQREAERQRVAS